MKLWIVRHGEAHMAYDDEQRELTEVGQDDIRALALLLQQEHANPHYRKVSPYVRTRQSYQILQQVNHWSDAEITTLLVPESSCTDLLQQIQTLQQDMLLVSHQPFVSNLLALLLDGSEQFFYRYFMAPGSIACVELGVYAPACGTLCYLKSPPYDNSLMPS